MNTKPAGDRPDIVLDISRLLSRFRHDTPTGVDRVELAYAREMLRQVPDRLAFGALHPSGHYGRLSTNAVVAFIALTEANWGQGRRATPRRMGRWANYANAMWRLRPLPVPRRSRRRVLVQSSPHHLIDEAIVKRILDREQAAFVCMLHDLIPVEFPEYAREGGALLHQKRVDTIERHAAALVSNSQATLDSFHRYTDDRRRDIPAIVAHVGLDSAASLQRVAVDPDRRPFFVCVGTIEPRKNHLLLLHAWRAMAVRHGAANIPKLVIVGRRGWENEQVVDLLERCTILQDCVEEHDRLADDEMHRMIATARALLLPSFAEGYGMPVPEALSAGVPVICSDLPALREAGGSVPEYLDPLDGPAWIQAVSDYADLMSPRRQIQLDRMAGWQAPSWAEHVARVIALSDEVAV